MNKIILMGRLCKDPEVRYTSDNKAVARFNIAIDRKYQKDETDFFNITAFGKLGEFAEKYLNKGTKVLVEGHIQNNNYEKDGKKVYSDQIIADSIEFCESKKSSGNTSNDDFQEVTEEENLPFV